MDSRIILNFHYMGTTHIYEFQETPLGNLVSWLVQAQKPSNFGDKYYLQTLNCLKIFVRFQKEWQRKEELYLKIIDYFEKGKQWEHALPLCKELAKVYEEKVFDFDKLSSVLRRQATLFDRVLSKSEENLRLDPEYFRVGFYGKGFPLFLRVST